MSDKAKEQEALRVRKEEEALRMRRRALLAHDEVVRRWGELEKAIFNRDADGAQKIAEAKEGTE